MTEKTKHRERFEDAKLKNWSDMATSQGMLGARLEQERMDFPLEPPEGMGLC